MSIVTFSNHTIKRSPCFWEKRNLPHTDGNGLFMNLFNYELQSHGCTFDNELEWYETHIQVFTYAYIHKVTSHYNHASCFAPMLERFQHALQLDYSPENGDCKIGPKTSGFDCRDMGIMTGMSDLILPMPISDQYLGLCLEMKSKDGIVSPTQYEAAKQMYHTGRYATIFVYCVRGACAVFRWWFDQHLLYRKSKGWDEIPTLLPTKGWRYPTYRFTTPKNLQKSFITVYNQTAPKNVPPQIVTPKATTPLTKYMYEVGLALLHQEEQDRRKDVFQFTAPTKKIKQ